ncbi:hypothetical protein QF025_007028 [Paraburkholderia graminis]|uniref:Transposase IS116/IS110/IS902 C-terminal domain-containing protein n=1 Tax=Paraburkholderia graminis TaxID=60548 RepID=A0ABD5CSI3_9BURK|nr:hypothetical protein [Paraburkholderia graminis]
MPARLISILERLHAHFKYLSEQIGEIDREMVRQLADDDLGQRLLSIPGVGPVTASVLAAEMGDGKQYACSWDFAASIGLVPRRYSTGGRANLLGISKRGDKNIRPPGAVRQSLHAAARAAIRPPGRVGSRHACTPTFQRGGLCVGQQAGTNGLGSRYPPHHVQCGSGSDVKRSIGLRISFTEVHPPGFAIAEI